MDERSVKAAPSGVVGVDPARPQRPRGLGLLLDDERKPSVRTVLGHLLSQAGCADFALRRVRLAALDFAKNELATLRRCRVLLGGLDVRALADAGAAVRVDPQQSAALDPVRELIASGRAEIRSAGTCRWIPDFAVLQGIPESGRTLAGNICLLGWLGLDAPEEPSGPLLTSVVTGSTAAAATIRHFERLWANAYDVLPIVAESLRHASTPVLR